MRPLCPCPDSKAYEKGTRGISWGPLLTLGPRAVPEFPNGQSAPIYSWKQTVWKQSLCFAIQKDHL
ncbi:unnamed protein product [Staurois parvus]|uniref:Uncharacterized protein n=1 Tax=Staurois parvus TaxID=386267 RepID=A0ABN9DSY8_9NEOB|nr:unnamed protein product [Staurois parvus]